MDVIYCNNCGSLHDPFDGKCLGCVYVKRIGRLEKQIKLTIRKTDEFLERNNVKSSDMCLILDRLETILNETLLSDLLTEEP